MNKLAFFLLLSLPLTFAAWETTAGLAVVASAALLACLFMVGMGFGINELQLMAKEEMFQLIATCVMVALFFGANGVLNTLDQGFAAGYPDMQSAATALLGDALSQTTAVYDQVVTYDHQIANEGSKGGSCNVLQVGYSVSGCGGYSMLPTPMSMAGNIAGFAVGELSAMLRFIQISDAFSINFLLPLGILLRTFKLTRGAGGFLIALGISLYIMLPLGVIFNEMMASTFINDKNSADGVSAYQPLASSYTIPSCNAMDTEPTFGGNDHITCPVSDTSSNEGAASQAYCTLRQDIKGYLYVVLIRATLGPVIALLMMMASLRAISSLAGAEVDVSAISRFV